MKHNVIIGKIYGEHLEFMQIRPLMKEGLCCPPKKITKLIIRSPCAKFRGYIPQFTPWREESMDSDDFLKLWVGALLARFSLFQTILKRYPGLDIM